MWMKISRYKLGSKLRVELANATIRNQKQDITFSQHRLLFQSRFRPSAAMVSAPNIQNIWSFLLQTLCPQPPHGSVIIFSLKSGHNWPSGFFLVSSRCCLHTSIVCSRHWQVADILVVCSHIVNIRTGWAVLLDVDFLGSLRFWILQCLFRAYCTLTSRAGNCF